MKLSSVRRWDWLSAILLFFMVQAAVTRLVITEWTDFLLFAQTLGTFGILLGMALGYSQFKRRTVVFLALGYSIVLIPWQLTLAIYQDVLLSERFASLGGRLYFSLLQFFQREMVEDGLLFVAFISIIAWLVSLISGYAWTRHQNYLVATLPPAIFILVIHLYDQVFTRRILLLATFILLALLLLGRLYYQKNYESWRERRIFQMQDSAFDLTRGMAIAASIFVLVAWTVPASQEGFDSAERTWRRLTEPWQEVQEWFSNAVEILDATSARRTGDMYGSQLGLGTGNPLSEKIIFSVETPALPENQPRYYWRGYVYDTYQNNRWYATDSVNVEFVPADSELLLPNIDKRGDALFIVRNQIPQSLLYTATQPIWVSRPGQVQYAVTETGLFDLIAWKASPGILPGEQYQVAAALTNPSIQQLQRADTEYPQWIQERYLQLPEDFSQRIRELANQVTQGMDTPYAKADAITKFLRSDIEYINPLPEAPPTGEDPLEWFLFASKQGFCNYYASAEVLMLRTLGIPARMAVGFAEGTFDNETNVYIVRNMNAHAWPEVYFPDIGWVEFEPTGNQAPLVRPDKPEEEMINGAETPRDPANTPGRDLDEDLLEDKLIENPEENPINQGGFVINPIFYYIGIAAILLVAFWFINRQYSIIERIPARLKIAYEMNGGQAPVWLKNWTLWTALTPIERSFETVNHSLRLLGKTPALFATPAERADLLIEKLPAATDAIQTLAEQLESSLFTLEPGNIGHARRASLSIWLYTMQSIFRKTLYGSSTK